jgi:hypothetical protein
MSVKEARERLYQRAEQFKRADSTTHVPLEEASVEFGRAKQKNANSRDKWKLKKRMRHAHRSAETQGVQRQGMQEGRTPHPDASIPSRGRAD